MTDARIIRVAGAIAEAQPLGDAALYELVEVGERRLLGEVIRIQDDVATIQVFEETNGLGLHEPVRRTGSSLMTRLGPGLLGSIIDGIGRPLEGLAERSGDFMTPGMTLPTLDPDTRWSFAPTVEAGAMVCGGDVLGVVEESRRFRKGATRFRTQSPRWTTEPRCRFHIRGRSANGDPSLTGSPATAPSSPGSGCSIFFFPSSREVPSPCRVASAPGKL